MVHYTLHYFDLFGRAEPLRMLFSLAGVEYTDRRFSFAEWETVKNEPIFVFGKAPILEVDGQILAESVAIARYLGEKFGLAGQNEFDKALVDSQMDLLIDFYQKIQVYYGAAAGGKATEEMRHKILEPARDEYFAILSDWIEKNATKSGFLVGPSITIADVGVFQHCLGFNKFAPGYYHGFPTIKKFVEQIKEIPAMKKHLAERADRPF